jgi:hypothetical protein
MTNLPEQSPLPILAGWGADSVVRRETLASPDTHPGVLLLDDLTVLDTILLPAQLAGPGRARSPSGSR